MSSKQNDKKAGADANHPRQLNPDAVAARKTDGAVAPADGKPSKLPQAIDRWFDDQLNQLFNDVSSEPLPPDLAKLIGQLKAQSHK